MQLPPETVRLVEQAWERYEKVVDNAPLMPNAKRTYLLHSRNFVRWLKDDFMPGATIRRPASRR
jgi:hypothetical protein